MEPTPAQAVSAGAPAWGAFITYLVLIIGIGFYASRRASAGLGEFFLAGRKLHRYVVALSAVASGRSAWLLIGFTGIAYKMGASAVWALAGYITVEFFLFLLYAPRLRRFSESYDCITLPDFYAERFEDRRGVLRILLAVIILLFMVSYVAAQFAGGGKAFAAGFGLQPTTGVLLTAGIVLLYTLLGGFLAVSLTDVFQALLMIVALVVLPITAIVHMGGWGIVQETLAALDPSLLDPAAIGLGALIGFLGIGLGSPGNPHILVRYMAIRDAKQLRTSAVLGTAWNIVMGLGALYVGLVGRALFPAASQLPGGDTEKLYPILAQQHLHPLLFGVVVASIFAAIMSTADSQLLVAASSVVRDVYEKVLKKGQTLPQKRLVLLSRIVVVLLVLAALGFGAVAEKVVFWLVLFAWAGLGAAIGPTSILALFWKRTTRAGVIAGLITGTVATILWYYTPALKSRLYELVPAFFLSLVVTVVVSLLTRPPEGAEKMRKVMEGRE